MLNHLKNVQKTLVEKFSILVAPNERKNLQEQEKKKIEKKETGIKVSGKILEFLNLLGIPESTKSDVAEFLIALLELESPDLAIKELSPVWPDFDLDELDEEFMMLPSGLPRFNSNDDSIHTMRTPLCPNFSIARVLMTLDLVLIKKNKTFQIDPRLKDFFLSSDVRGAYEFFQFDINLIVIKANQPEDLKIDNFEEKIEITSGVTYITASQILSIDTKGNTILKMSDENFMTEKAWFLILLASRKIIPMVDSDSSAVKRKSHAVENFSIFFIVFIQLPSSNLELEFCEALSCGLPPSKINNFRCCRPKISTNSLPTAFQSLSFQLSDQELHLVHQKIENLKKNNLSTKFNAEYSRHNSNGLTDAAKTDRIIPELVCFENGRNPFDVIEELKLKGPEAQKLVIMAYGKPGTGKSAFARMLGYQTHEYRFGEDRREAFWSGSQERLLSTYKLLGPTDLFVVDECENLCGVRSDDVHLAYQNSLTTTMLQLLDPDTPGASVYLTTNLIDHLDLAVLNRATCKLHFVATKQYLIAFAHFWGLISNQRITQEEEFIVKKAFENLDCEIPLRAFKKAAGLFQRNSQSRTLGCATFLKLVFNQIEG